MTDPTLTLVRTTQQSSTSSVRAPHDSELLDRTYACIREDYWRHPSFEAQRTAAAV